MLTIPAAINTLLGGKVMMGSAGAPTWSVTVNPCDGADTVSYVRSIRIERQMYQAAMCELTLDNAYQSGIAAGRYAPDDTGAWQEHLWPNSTLIVRMGYGSELQTVFTGLIDRIEMQRTDDGGSIMVVTARDYYKRCLDQLCTSADEHIVTYTAQTVEAIVADLAENSAGFAAGDITTWTTGITIAERTFTYESVADALTWLCDISSSEVVITETGAFVFRQATDRQPQASDEAIVLTSTNWTNLAKTYVVSDSERVRSAAAGGGTLYVEGAAEDYEIEYGSPARIRRTATSSIASGATVYVTYVYAAWSFLEDTHIFRLGYTINDEDLAPYIVVEGEDAEGVPVVHKQETYLAAYWHLPTNKKLYVRAPDARTVAECQEIAERMSTRMAQRARRCEFAAPGNPYLQLGDCVRVYESTTTVSEIYRIVGMELRMNDREPFAMQIDTRYYGYTPEPS